MCVCARARAFVCILQIHTLGVDDAETGKEEEEEDPWNVVNIKQDYQPWNGLYSQWVIGSAGPTGFTDLCPPSGTTHHSRKIQVQTMIPTRMRNKRLTKIVVVGWLL